MTNADAHLDDDAFTALALAHLEGRADEAQHASLASALAASADLRRRFNRLCVQLWLLHQRSSIAATDAPLPLRPAPSPPRAKVRVPTVTPTPTLRPPKRLVFTLAAALLLAAAAAFAIYLFAFSNPQSEIRNPKSPTPIATVIDTSGGGTLAAGDTIANPGDLIRSGDMSLDTGSAEFRLDNGVGIRLAGRCKLTIDNPMWARLAAGSAEFDCPPAAIGYTVHLPGGAKVVDLGTRFRLTVDPDGSTGLVVLEGRVVLQREDGGDRHELTAGSTARVGPDAAITVTRDAGVPLPGAVIRRADDWRDAGTTADTGWDFRQTFSTTPDDAWRSLGEPLMWNAQKRRFQNPGRHADFPVVTAAEVRIDGGAVSLELRRWAFVDWVCPVDGLQLEANDGVLESRIGDPAHDEAAGSHLVVAIYDASSGSWTALVDSIADDDQQAAIPADRRRFTLDAGDRIRIAWRATGPHDAPARLDDSALAFRVVAVGGSTPTQPRDPNPSDSNDDRGRDVPSAGELDNR